MGRFSSLELDDAQKEKPHVSAAKEFGDKLKDGNYYLKEAVTQFRLCNFDKALELFSKVLGFDPNNEIAWICQVRCLINLKEFGEAVKWSDKAVEIIGETPELLATKATAYCRMGDFSRAFGYSDVSLEKKGNSPFVWISRGEILLQNKNKNAGICFDKAIAANNNSWEILIEIARVFLFYNQTAKALTFLEKGCSLSPTTPVIWYEYGNCYNKMGMKDKAIESYEKAIELEPDFSFAKQMIKNTRKMGFFKALTKRLLKK